MADKAISELTAATQVTALDLFVLEQSGAAKKLTGQVLENWLVSFADGHGGIQSIQKKSTSGLKDTYTITLADTTTFDFVVTNGRSITSFTKTGTSGLNDTYRISYNDGTSTTITVTNGAKGDKGDNAYVHFKWASQKPTAASHSIGDIPDNWIGIYTGNAASAPTDWQAYTWFQYKGEKGNTGDPATMAEDPEVLYSVGDSGSVYPSSGWVESIPVVPQGKYLWSRTTLRFNTGNPVVIYAMSRMGIDGTGSVSQVAGISPNSDGNVPLTADDIGALPRSGGYMTGSINMNGQSIAGLNDPRSNDEAANKAYTDKGILEIKTYADKLNSGMKVYVDGAKLQFSNIVVSKSAFVADGTHSDYPYRAAVALSGVLSSMIPQVALSVEDAASGNFAPAAESYNGGVYLYAASVPDGNITIPTMIFWRGNA